MAEQRIKAKDGTTSIASKSVMRKSCHFCRTRKIRCSGHQICAACRTRNIDCVYEPESFKGRPRGATALLKTGQPRKAIKDSTSREIHASKTARPSSNHSDHGEVNCGPTGEDGSDSDAYITRALENIFRRKFIDQRSTDYIDVAKSPLKSKEENEVGESGFCDLLASNQHIPCTEVGYQRMFFGITQGLVELILPYYGSLGCYETQDNQSRLLALNIANDSTQDMFDEHSQPSAISWFSDHKVRQMIELWFIHHPLSVILSKSLLIHDYRNGCHDPALLAVILSDAIHGLGDESPDAAPKMLQWAMKHVAWRDNSKPSLATIQTVMLIGWHMLCFSSARRGYCYIEFAKMAIHELQARLREKERSVDLINGVDLGEVESELCERIYWLTYGIDLWTRLHFNLPLTEDKLPDTSVRLPPMNESTSAVFKLDKESGNVASLRVQQRYVQYLWPLGHIVSTIAPIYALYIYRSPNVSEQDDWKTDTFTKLRSLIKGPATLSNVCHEVRAILREGAGALELQMANHPSQIFALSTYKILDIHLLFPRQDLSPTVAMDGVRLENIIQSLHSFRDLLILAEHPWDTESELLGSHAKTRNATLLILGLDACSRALDHIANIHSSGTTAERAAAVIYSDSFAELSQFFHFVAKRPILQTGVTARLIKKKLKNTKLYFECIQRPQSTNHDLQLDIPIFNKDNDWLHEITDTSSTSLGSNWETSLEYPDYRELGL